MAATFNLAQADQQSSFSNHCIHQTHHVNLNNESHVKDRLKKGIRSCKMGWKLKPQNMQQIVKQYMTDTDLLSEIASQIVNCYLLQIVNLLSLANSGQIVNLLSILFLVSVGPLGLWAGISSSIRVVKNPFTVNHAFAWATPAIFVIRGGLRSKALVLPFITWGAESMVMKFHGNVQGEVRVNFLALFAPKPHIFICGALKLSWIVRANVRLNIAIPMFFFPNPFLGGRGFFYPCRTLKSLEKKGKNTNKKRLGNPCKEKIKEFQRNKRKDRESPCFRV